MTVDVTFRAAHSHLFNRTDVKGAHAATGLSVKLERPGLTSRDRLQRDVDLVHGVLEETLKAWTSM